MAEQSMEFLKSVIAAQEVRICQEVEGLTPAMLRAGVDVLMGYGGELRENPPGEVVREIFMAMVCAESVKTDEVKLEPIEFSLTTKDAKICIRGSMPIPDKNWPLLQKDNEMWHFTISQIKCAIPKLIASHLAFWEGWRSQ